MAPEKAAVSRKSDPDSRYFEPGRANRQAGPRFATRTGLDRPKMARKGTRAGFSALLETP
jgi:hypothetical protein